MKPISVLLADDHAVLRRTVTRFLQECCDDEVVVVGAVSSGLEALAQAATLQPDVVLMDLSMPDLPGIQAIARLRAALPTVGIIALTLWDGSPYQRAALDAGADDFVSKVHLSADLLPAIRRVAPPRKPK